ncbi:ATP-binding cassette domain-containing protein [Methylotetracoccus oryzae]|uniref:ATP-binding cassette domain-containing protein n=1 Tax=Methylotetracoccus oryzae TaxID=1919059 RepID=UPI001117AEAA
MIEIRNVTKSYLTNAGRHFVFRNLSFTFNGDKNIALLGANGAGKSTLIRMLGGVEAPDTGSIFTGGKRLSWPVNFASTAQATLSGRDTVKFVCRILGVEGGLRDQKLTFVNEFAALGKAFDKAVKTYSSGMRSRLVFAMTMAFDFDYYLIDEVTAVGDTAFKEKSRAILREKMKSANILLVSHNMKMVREFCDEVVLLREGVLAAYVNLEEGIRAYQGPAYRAPQNRSASGALRVRKVLAGASIYPGEAGSGRAVQPRWEVAVTREGSAANEPEPGANDVRRQGMDGESASRTRGRERRRAKNSARLESASIGRSQPGLAADRVVRPASAALVVSPGPPNGPAELAGVAKGDLAGRSAVARGGLTGTIPRKGRKDRRRGQGQVGVPVAKPAGTMSAGNAPASGVRKGLGRGAGDARGTTAAEGRRRPQSHVAIDEHRRQEVAHDAGVRRGRKLPATEGPTRGDARGQGADREPQTVATASATAGSGTAQGNGTSGTAQEAVARTRNARGRLGASESKARSPAASREAGSSPDGTRRSRPGRTRGTGANHAANLAARQLARDGEGLVQAVEGLADKPRRRRNAFSGNARRPREANGEGSVLVVGEPEARPGDIRPSERAETPGQLSKSGNTAALSREDAGARKRLREKRAGDEAERRRVAVVSEAFRLPEGRDLQPKSATNGSRSARIRKNPKVKGLPTGDGRQP